ncbi:hypothetical protein MKX01_018342 [Papaver californicum]|nr:hypothetical protein MKX01_018342 [Papaver californicum]
MRELTLENIRGMRLKVTLWGDATSKLSMNLYTQELNPRPVVAVVAGAYVKQYLGKPLLSSTNATKIYFNPAIPEALHIQERISHRAPPREITLPARVGHQQANQYGADTTKTISELMESKWKDGYNLLNRKVCRAKAVGIAIDEGWFYLDATTARQSWLE